MSKATRPLLHSARVFLFHPLQISEGKCPPQKEREAQGVAGLYIAFPCITIKARVPSFPPFH